MWAETDHIHLVPDAYSDLAKAVLEAGVEVESDGAASTVSESSKRKQLESVLTRLSTTTIKQNRGLAGQPRHLAWLRGLNKPRAPT